LLNSTSAVCRRVQNQNGSGTSISKNNAKTVRDRNTAADITEAADGDDDDDEGNSDEGSENATKDEDGEGEGVKGQARSSNGDRLAVFTSQLEQ
jgi:hypothetical protein